MQVRLRGTDANGQWYDFDELTYPSTFDDVRFAIELIKRKYPDIVHVQVDIAIPPVDPADGQRRPWRAQVAQQRNN